MKFFSGWRRRPAASPPTPTPRPRPIAPAVPEVALLHLRTGYGTWLAVDPQTRRVAASDSAEPAHRLLCLLGINDPTLALLLAPDGGMIEIDRDGCAAPVLSARLQRTPERGVVRLRHPLQPRCCLGATEDRDRTISFEIGMSASLGRLWTYPADRFLAGPAAAGLLTGLARLLVVPLSAEAVLSGLRDGSLDASLLPGLVRALPWDELASLADRLLRAEADRALLVRAMPEDSFVATGLPALAAWLRDRPAAPPTLVCPPQDDVVTVPSRTETRPQAGMTLLALARRSVAPRRGACVVATARSEGIYLIDWLAHHRALGFEHTFLYTNGNDDGSDPLLAALARGGAITWIHNELGPQSRPQLKAYGHAFKKLPHLLDYRWAAVIDLDEYIGLDSRMFGGIDDLLGWMQTDRTDAIALNWLMYGASATAAYSAAPVAERFLHRERPVNAHVKSLCRPRLFWDTQMHFPYPTLDAPFVYRDERGELHHHAGVSGRIAAFAATPRAERAWINHYFLRSAPEALLKVARGRADWASEVTTERTDFLNFVVEQFSNLAQHAVVEDRRCLDCAPTARSQAASLRALPGVADAEAAVRDVTQARVRQIVAGFASLPAGADEPPSFAMFREALGCSV